METEVVASTLTSGIAYDDLGRGIRWLTDVLGLRVAKVWGPEDSPLFAYMVWRTGIVSVWVRPPDNPWSKVGPTSIDLHAAHEQTVERAYERAVAAGADIVKPLKVERNPAVPAGYLGFALRDPEGNLWSMGTGGPRLEIADDEGDGYDGHS
jgi:uncharacterized glyoxalase superfamily protein PhnB